MCNSSAAIDDNDGDTDDNIADDNVSCMSGGGPNKVTLPYLHCLTHSERKRNCLGIIFEKKENYFSALCGPFIKTIKIKIEEKK